MPEFLIRVVRLKCLESGKMILVDKDSGEKVAKEVEFADSFWRRFRGLMFRRDFGGDEALLFKFSDSKKFGVHTFFVFFPIDLIYLDREMKVLEIKEELPSWSTYKPDVEVEAVANIFTFLNVSSYFWNTFSHPSQSSI